MLCTNHIIGKFTLSDSLFGDCCGGTFSVAKECVLLSLHWRLDGCSLELEYVASSLPQSGLVFAWQVLNKEPKITGDDHVQQAALTFINAMESLDQKRRIDISETSTIFSIVQTVLLHILYHLGIYHTVNSFFAQAENIPENLSTSCWYLRLDMVDIRLPLAIYCSAISGKVTASNILLENV